MSIVFYFFQFYEQLFIGQPCSVKWRNYKAVRRNRLMQSWLTDLPAIQTGMLVVSAVTFHSTGSEARPRLTTATVKQAESPLRTFLYSQNYCYLLWPFQTEEVEALSLIAATGTWLCHNLWWTSCAALCARLLFPMLMDKYYFFFGKSLFNLFV